MAAFVLVHGGLHGGWCWERLVPLLAATGHRVEAIDLPGSDRGTPAAEVDLASYRAATVAAAERAGEPAILVGHSLGGRSISAAAEERPDLIKALVYVSAILPSSDQPVMLPSADDNIIANGFFPVDDGISVMLDEASARAGFYSDCSEADARTAFTRLAPQPIAAMTEPVHLTPERWGAVPRYYVFTREDRCIPIAVQQQMERAAPCARTFELPSGHSPFYTHPQALAKMLCEIATEV